jgi:midasin
LLSLEELHSQQTFCVDEHGFVDLKGLVTAALAPGDNQNSARVYPALSLLCELFQIPVSLKMQLLQANIADFNTSLAQYIMHDAEVHCGLVAENAVSPIAAVHIELAELAKQLQLVLSNDPKAATCSMNIGGYDLPCRQGANAEVVATTVHTPTTAYNLRSLALSVLTRRPVVIQGSSGSGKSHLIRTLAQAMGCESDIIELHINDQTDSKTLIGSYVCSDVPGEFIWQAGVLTQAVLTGKWVVVENIDHVPLEFVATIAPLLARRRIYLPHRDKEVPAHPNFRLFGTRLLSIPALVASSDGQTLLPPWQGDAAECRAAAAAVDYNSLVYMPTLQHFSHLFHFVCVHELSLQEVQRILCAQFPSILPGLIEKLLSVYVYINGEPTTATSGKRQGAALTRVQRFGSGKKFNLREMLKAAGRIQANCGEFNHASGFMTDLQKRTALQEVVDVFAGSIRTRSVYEEVVQVLGGIWGVSEAEVSAYFLNTAGDDVATQQAASAVQRAEGLVRIGRATIVTRPSKSGLSAGDLPAQREQNFAMTKYSLRLLERVAVCVSRNEPVLLVGETGTGKTTSVQELADILGKKLTVQNLSLSTDVSDLLGGYRPVTMKQLFLPMYETFVRLFNDTLSSSQNTEFLQIVAKFYQAQSWKRLLKAFLKASDQAAAKLNKAAEKARAKGDAAGAIRSEEALQQWASFRAKIARYEANLSKIEFGFAFQFVDGLLVEALRQGDWVLLDEINLASSETLQGLSGVLDADSALFLTEKGSGELVPVTRHPDFRVFAAMNPPTDVGKKELPPALLGRFTEIYTEELTDPADLRTVVERYIGGINTSSVESIVSVYLGCRAAAEDHLTDSTGQRPRYSLRSLTRSLQAAKSFLTIGIRPFNRALYESFLLNFQTLLSEGSRAFMDTFLKQSLYREGNAKELSFPPSRPGGRTSTSADWVLVKPFWLRAGPLTPVDWAEKDDLGMTRFVLTKTVDSNIRSLAAAVGAQVAPVLIQV